MYLGILVINLNLAYSRHSLILSDPTYFYNDEIFMSGPNMNWWPVLHLFHPN